MKIIAAAILLVFTALAFDAARRDAPTYDEALHIASGYSYLKTGRYWMDVDHPPLGRVILAAPLLALAPEVDTNDPAWRQRLRYEFADAFFYRNTVAPERLLLAARLMAIAMGVLLGVLLWAWANALFGPGAATAALLFYCFSPPVLAHAHLATNDMAVTSFYTLALYLFWKFMNAPSRGRAAAAGAAFAAALAVKFSAVILLPTYAGLFLWEWRSDPTRARRAVMLLPWCAAAAFVAILFAYGIVEWRVFVDGLGRISSNVALGRSSFLLGRYSDAGWPHYFVAAFLLKTPAAFLALLGLSLGTFRRWRRREFLLAWVYGASALFVLVASMSKVQIGHRHILPVYPLLCLALGEAAHRLWRERAGKPAVAVLCAWIALAAAWAHPHHIAYFNELSGGSRNGLFYLSDSNLDWGQELKALGSYARERGVGAIYLSYFGTADPRAYGVRHVPVLSVGNVPRPSEAGVSLHGEREVLLAVSATNLQGVYYRDRGMFAWLRERRPAKVLGHSLFVYDLTGDAEAHERLAKIFSEAGLPGNAALERRWADELRRPSAP